MILHSLAPHSTSACCVAQVKMSEKLKNVSRFVANGHSGRPVRRSVEQATNQQAAPFPRRGERSGGLTLPTAGAGTQASSLPQAPTLLMNVDGNGAMQSSRGGEAASSSGCATSAAAVQACIPAPSSSASIRLPAKRTREDAPHEAYPMFAAENVSGSLELTAKLLALRQYIEVLEMAARDKYKKAKEAWELPIMRDRLVPNVLEWFKPLQFPWLIWRTTVVDFVNEHGIDEGGLTADLHSSFWREVLKPEHGLFEQLADGGAYLPCADADVSQLTCVGRFLLKSIIDAHPTGPGLSSFVIEFICNAYQARTFRDSHPNYALQLLANVDSVVARSWSALLHATEEELQTSFLSLDDFDDSLPAEPLTRANVARAVVAGCRRKLLDDRSSALAALRGGFTLGGKVDLSLQLAQHANADLVLLLQGNAVISASDLLDCFDWSNPPDACATSVRHLHGVIRADDAQFDMERRCLLLRFCTGLNALPVTGLEKKVAFNFLDTPGGLPEPHTCTHELDLPAYSCRAELLEKICLALDSFKADSSFGKE